MIKQTSLQLCRRYHRCLTIATATVITTTTATTSSATNDADIDHADKKDNADNIEVKCQSVIRSSDSQSVESWSVNQS